LSAVRLERQVRAFDPWPGAHFLVGDERVRVLAAEVIQSLAAAAPGTVLDERLTIACGEDSLQPLRLQRAGRGPIDAAAFLRGFALPPGSVLLCPLQADDRILRYWLCRLATPDQRSSVQEALEIAVQRFCGASITVFGAGRTDAGVHALAQVAHIDLSREAPPDEIRSAVNHHLRPHAITVLLAEPVGPEFDARLSAIGRHYRYRILNRRAPPALERGRVWHVAPPLDVAAMQQGAHHLIGHHDFSTFRDSMCQAKSPVKTLDALDLQRVGEEIQIEARARSFLHHQVRNMVGTLKLVGIGRWHPDDVARALAARDRRAGGPTAPADGLALVAVRYDVMSNNGTP